MKPRGFLSVALSCVLLSQALCGCSAPQQPQTESQEQPQIQTEAEQSALQPEEDSPLPAEETAQPSGEVVDLGPLLDEGVPLAGAPALSVVLSPQASGTQTKGNDSALVDYSNTADGYVMVKWTAGGTPKLKVLVVGPNSGAKYQYNLRTDGEYETFPLSDGNGNYTVGVYQNVSGSDYATVLTCSMAVQLKDEFAPFLRPNQYVTYAQGNATVDKAAQLCAGLTDNLEKVNAIYTFVIGHLTYDKEKAATVKSGYLPDVDETLSSGKGICFDYAALMAAMLRSQNVPVKLVVGYTGSVYHAWLNVYSETEGWIEAKVYFDGQQWKLMDPTFASSGNQSSAIMEYIGNGENYTAKYLY